MSAANLPAQVRDLIASSIDSIAELEALLLLRDRRDREWSPEEASARLYVSVPVGSYVLAVLASRGFFVEEKGRYRYAPASPDLEEAVAALAHAYSRQLIAVTHLIHAKPSSSILQFAEAFRLRKEE